MYLKLITLGLCLRQDIWILPGLPSEGVLMGALFNDLAAFKTGLLNMLARPDPQFAVSDIVPVKLYPRCFDIIHSRDAREVFRKALNRLG